MGNSNTRQKGKTKGDILPMSKIKHIYDPKGMEITFILKGANNYTGKKFWNLDYLSRYPNTTETITLVFEDGYTHTVERGKPLKLPYNYTLQK